MAGVTLPKQFSALQRFVPDWVFPTERARNLRRVRSTMAELKDYYDTFLPRLGEIIAYLNTRQVGHLDPSDETLFRLAQMYYEVSPCVEFYKHNDLPDAYEHSRFNIHF